MKTKAVPGQMTLDFLCEAQTTTGPELDAELYAYGHGDLSVYEARREAIRQAVAAGQDRWAARHVLVGDGAETYTVEVPHSGRQALRELATGRVHTQRALRPGELLH